MSDTQPIGGGLIKNDGYSRETVIHWGKYEYLMSGGREGRGGGREEGEGGEEGGVGGGYHGQLRAPLAWHPLFTKKDNSNTICLRIMGDN
jgi:hypothetical protein